MRWWQEMDLDMVIDQSLHGPPAPPDTELLADLVGDDHLTLFTHYMCNLDLLMVTAMPSV